MARLNSGAGKSKRKKKSALPTPRSRAAGKTRKTKTRAAAEKAAPNEDEPAQPSVGRMERTRRLLLAALHVWELKRRVRD